MNVPIKKIPRLCSASASFAACAASPKKDHHTQQKTQIIPESRVGKRINFVIGEQTDNKAEENDKPMQQTVPESGRILNRRGRLGCASREQSDQGQRSEKKEKIFFHGHLDFCGTGNSSCKQTPPTFTEQADLRVKLLNFHGFTTKISLFFRFVQEVGATFFDCAVPATSFLLLQKQTPHFLIFSRVHKNRLFPGSVSGLRNIPQTDQGDNLPQLHYSGKGSDKKTRIKILPVIRNWW
jgi:hypothetical protein